MIFRSYKPIDEQTFDHTPVQGGEQMMAVERVIGEQLEDTKVTTVKDSLVSVTHTPAHLAIHCYVLIKDLTTLAPRKVDWDLRRGIEDKLEKLEKRTQKAVVQLIRK